MESRFALLGSRPFSLTDPTNGINVLIATKATLFGFRSSLGLGLSFDGGIFWAITVVLDIVAEVGGLIALGCLCKELHFLLKGHNHVLMACAGDTGLGLGFAVGRTGELTRTLRTKLPKLVPYYQSQARAGPLLENVSKFKGIMIKQTHSHITTQPPGGSGWHGKSG